MDDAASRFDVATLVGRELDAWDRIVAGFDDFSIEQSLAYMTPRVGRGRLCGALFRRPGSSAIAGAALVALAVTPVAPRGVAFVKFGPLWRPRGEPASTPALAGILGAIREEFAGRRRLGVRLFPPPDPEFHDAWAAALARAGYLAGSFEADPKRYFVDLALSEAEQLASLGKDWRSNLRKASKELAIEEVDPKAALGRFMGLYEAMWNRKRYTDRHNIAMLSQLVATAPADFRLRMFMASYEGRPVAATIAVGPGERIFVIYGASSDAALALRAGYALRWWMVGALRDSGSRWLDLGGAEGNEGLRHFKEGLIGKRGRVALNPAEQRCGADPISGLVGVGLDTARDLLHRLEALGPASGSRLWRRLAGVVPRRPPH